MIFDNGLVALYVGTLAMHAVFVGYVVGGTAYVLVKRDAIADIVRDRLPFMLGCGITAGVAPLLFLQLLHQTRFYTANLLLGPRWLAVVPALIAGFYALYLAKQRERWRRPALVVALACFVFVAYSWSELHELMQADPEWRAFYAAGSRVFGSGMIAPRVVVLLGAMVTLFATVAAWSAPSRRPLALLALCARVVSLGGAIWLWRAGFAVAGAALAWFYVLVAALVVEAAGWIAVTRVQGDLPLAIATAGGAAALVSATVVREGPRLSSIEPPHALAAAAGGHVVFAIAVVLGVAAIAWIVRVTR